MCPLTLLGSTAAACCRTLGRDGHPGRGTRASGREGRGIEEREGKRTMGVREASTILYKETSTSGNNVNCIHRGSRGFPGLQL